MPDDPSPNNGQGRPAPPPLSPLVPGRPGHPTYSLEALRERVERQFLDETRPDILLDLPTEAQRRALLSEIADYVFAVESVTLSEHDRQAILDKAYRNLFTFGPLDEWLRDDEITEITVRGPRDIHVRRGLGSLETVLSVFEDSVQLEGLLQRVLSGAGIAFEPDTPFLEAGVTLLDRAARIGLVGPPISPDLSLEIRLHPRQPVTLGDLHARFNALPPQAAALLTAILSAGHGLLIVGDVGTGKTTLAGALAGILPAGLAISAAERAAELALPSHAARHAARDFPAQLRAALDDHPAWLIVDEIRGGEPLWDVLGSAAAPRCLWVFRGDPRPERLRSALGMVIRQQRPTLDQADLHRALARHLPFVAALRQVPGGARLAQIAEWAFDETSPDSLDLRPLLVEQDGAWRLTGQRSAYGIDLPDSGGE